jgi:hypothetical protein
VGYGGATGGGFPRTALVEDLQAAMDAFPVVRFLQGLPDGLPGPEAQAPGGIKPVGAVDQVVVGTDRKGTRQQRGGEYRRRVAARDGKGCGVVALHPGVRVVEQPVQVIVPAQPVKGLQGLDPCSRQAGFAPVLNMPGQQHPRCGLQQPAEAVQLQGVPVRPDRQPEFAPYRVIEEWRRGAADRQVLPVAGTDDQAGEST